MKNRSSPFPTGHAGFETPKEPLLVPGSPEDQRRPQHAEEEREEEDPILELARRRKGGESR